MSDACSSARPTDSDIIILAPGQKKTVDFDFSSERWLVEDDDKVSRIGALEWTEQFRIVYRPPQEKDCRYLEQRDLIWHGHLPSRVFHGRGQID